MANKRKIGLPPGTLIYTGDKTELPVKITYTEYNEEDHHIEIYDKNEQLPVHESNEDFVQWYDIRGLHDLDLIQQISKAFGVHSLYMEDIVDVNKRPSYEEYQHGHFISFNSFEYSIEDNKVNTQTISLFFGKGFVLTFQEHEDDAFKILRDRIASSKGRIRQRGSDYLAYSIIDMIVDRYYHLMDQIEDNLEALELKISEDANSVDKGELHETKVNLIKIRKTAAPLREVINQFIRSESALIDPRTELFLRDLYDHTLQIVESTDTLRDMLAGLQDLYISEISLKMNKIMQFLTIVTAIFVPLSFLTGLYGMNFENIPELKVSYGYFILWAFMLLIVLLMLWWFRKQKWL
ncbi:MAG: magnesium/cobalt transporter CorA [Bacteroidota bacterium]